MIKNEETAQPQKQRVLQKSTLVNTLLNALPALLALGVPLFFLPLTTEFFEFNKLTLVVISTVLMALLWIAKMVINKKFTITKSPLDLPILAFMITVILATIFSLHKTSSIFGTYGKWFPSLFGITTFVTLYYIISENISSVKNIKNILRALLLGITISSTIALLRYYGVNLGQAPYLKSVNFTTTGSIITTGIIAALGVSLGLKNVMSGKLLGKIIAVVVTLINLLCAILISSVASWVVLGLGLLVFAYYLTKEDIIRNQHVLIPLTAIVLLMITLMVTPVTRERIINSNYPNMIGLSPRESWIIVSKTITDFPFLGTGPGTFELNYTRYKPASINSKDYWNIRFNNPYSQSFAVIGSLGIVGVIVSLFLVIRVLKLAMFNKIAIEDRGVNGMLVIAIVSLIGASFFSVTSITTTFILVLSVALLVAQNKIEGKNTRIENVSLSLSSLNVTNNMSLVNTEKEVFQYIVAIPIAVVAGFGAFLMYKQYAGEYFMRRSFEQLQEGKGGVTYQTQQKAIRANPTRSTYYNSMSSTALLLANAISQQENLGDEEKTTIQNLIAQTIRNSKAATEVINPLSASNWETRASFYSSLSKVTQDADKWSVDAYQKSIQLDPSNARLRLALGGVYFGQEDYLSAANQFSLATSLKPDYANAHYNLAQALKKLEKPKQAFSELKIVRNLINEGTKEYEAIEKEIAELAKLPEVAGNQTKPTVQEIETSTKEKTATQEPLENVSSQQKEEVIEVEKNIVPEETNSNVEATQ